MLNVVLGSSRTTPRARTLAVAAFVGLGVVLSGPMAPPLHAATDCEDISGVYDVNVNLPGGGPTQIELDLEQTECEVTGFVGASTGTRIKNGLVEGWTASFTFDAPNQGDGSTLEIRWEITIDGDDVTGTFSHDLFGDIPVVGARAERS